jgi:hypothetical protein
VQDSAVARVRPRCGRARARSRDRSLVFGEGKLAQAPAQGGSDRIRPGAAGLTDDEIDVDLE